MTYYHRNVNHSMNGLCPRNDLLDIPPCPPLKVCETQIFNFLHLFTNLGWVQLSKKG